MQDLMTEAIQQKENQHTKSRLEGKEEGRRGRKILRYSVQEGKG